MKARFLFLPALLATAGLFALPALAEDKKKKKKSPDTEEQKPSTLEQIQDQLRRQLNPQPVPGVVVNNGQLVKVRITNNTGQPVEFVWLNPNGTQQSYGFLQPTEPGGDPAIIETYGGHQWLFRVNGRVIQTFTATNKREQALTFGQGAGQVVQIPPMPQVPQIVQPKRSKRGVVAPDTLPVQDGRGLPPAGFDEAPQDAGVQEFLRVHNDARARVGVAPLRWSATLARYAQQWADHLASTGQFTHRDLSATGYGENMFGGSDGSPGDAARYWLEEKNAYRGGAITPQNFGDVGHYTQMVWSETTEVGFGIARGGGGVVVVANYAPAGNGNGRKPY